MSSQKKAKKNKSPEPTLLIELGNRTIRTEFLKRLWMNDQVFLPQPMFW